MPFVDQLSLLQDSELRDKAHSELNPEDQTALTEQLSKQPATLAQLHTLMSCSQYARNTILRDIRRLPKLFREFDISRSFTQEAFKNTIGTQSMGASDLDDMQFNAMLRQSRQMCMLRIIWRDANRIASLQQTTSELTWLAEESLQQAIDYHTSKLQARFGKPRNIQEKEQPFIVLGMGKLGAWELNLSSDIDLIFAFPEKGLTDGGDNGGNEIANEDYFSRLGKKVIQSLDAVTADGFVFRVDMRLRPYGQSGALVSSFAALEDYYQSQGREWERYAMVKARIVASSFDSEYPRELMQLLRSFTYRKYVDFSVIDALRNLKTMIRQEVRRRKLDNDIKLGAGGIREIEFIAQVFQLIRGGRDTELQDNRLANVLPLLEQLQCLPQGTAEKLLEAYTFLRNTEHAIQAWQDAQTQTLPINDDARDAMLESLRFSDWNTFSNELARHQQLVSKEFDAVIGGSDGPSKRAASERASGIWAECSEPLTIDEKTYAERFSPALSEFANGSVVLNLTAKGKERLDQFVPILIDQALKEDSSEHILERIIPLVRSIVRRSAYMVLLVENPSAINQLIRLTKTSQQIADQLAKHPALLDELLDAASLYTPPEKSDLVCELQRVMLRIEESDLEQQMEALRYFKLSHTLKIAACEVAETLPLMKVSDYLTVLAEVILAYCLELVWKTMTTAHGFPDGNSQEIPEFIVIGYGKLGGIEMNHGSDLDLVFVYDADLNGQTDGTRPLDNQTFFTRLGQKMIHILNTRTASGRLYEVDMRLRPSGNSGMLASTLNAFTRYQQNDAWTWEHQALVRARAIAGSAKLTQSFNELRQQILQQKRELPSLRKDIVDMRLKMREHLGSKGDLNKEFDLKQDAGGIVDIEFMVQYMALAWSYAEPALATYTDNIRILEALAHTNRLSTQEVEQLIDAYKVLRTVLHRLTIEQLPNVIDGTELVAERDSVISIWQRLLEAK